MTIDQSKRQQDETAKGRIRVVASYPLDAQHIAVRLGASVDPGYVSVSLAGGREIRDTAWDAGTPDRLVLTIEPRSPIPLELDHVVLSVRDEPVIGPPFVHGPLTAMELKVPQFDARFPFPSRLVGAHVTVACCTGCDGGVHDRGLVVVNDHLGGGWSGVWIRTPQPIEGPYPRWQKMLFAGGVVHDHGSTEVVDHGWMEISRDDEEPHHAPPPLAISCADVPAEPTTSLRSRSLDASWVELSSLTVTAAESIEAPLGRPLGGRLPFTKISVTDASGSRSTAYLFQSEREAVKVDTRIRSLRGFVHAEAPGQYVLLTDKSEDIEI